MKRKIHFFIFFLILYCNTSSTCNINKGISGISIIQTMKVRTSEQPVLDSFADKVYIYKYNNKTLYNHFNDYTSLISGIKTNHILQDFLVVEKDKTTGFLYQQCPANIVDSCKDYSEKTVAADSMLKQKWYNKIVIDMPISDSNLKQNRYNSNEDSLTKVYDISKASGDTITTGTLSLLYVKTNPLPLDYSLQTKYETEKGMKLCKVDIHVETSIKSSNQKAQTSEVFFTVVITQIVSKDTDVLLGFLNRNE